MHKAVFFKSILYTILLAILCGVLVIYIEDTNKNFNDTKWWKQATPEQVKEEIIKGSFVNGIIPEKDMSPLMYAAMYNLNPDVIEILIKHNADINIQTTVGYSALLLAAKYNENPEILEILIKHGADVNAKDKVENKTVLDYAKENPKIYNTETYKHLQELMDK